MDKININAELYENNKRVLTYEEDATVETSNIVATDNCVIPVNVTGTEVGSIWIET